MDNIFDTNNLYPGYESPLKQHFNGHFECVFISFSPFFQIADNKNEKIEVSSTKIIELKELQETDSIFKNLKPNDNRVIYTNDNPNYPTKNEIIEQGNAVTWQYILDNAGFENLQEVSQALRTSIGALNKEFQTLELKETLEKFTIKNSIYHPIEGRITVLSLIKIYHCLIAMKKVELLVADEFFQNSETINLASLTCPEFILKVRGYVYFFPVDKSLLFTIEWDSFFFLICGDQRSLNHIINKFEFEGFYCDNETMHNWDLKK